MQRAQAESGRPAIHFRDVPGILAGFLLSLCLQYALMAVIVPQIEMPEGDVVSVIKTYSISHKVGFGASGGFFLALAFFMPSSFRKLAIGMAICGIVDLSLLLVAVL